MRRWPCRFHAVLGALVLLLVATPVHAQSGTPSANPAYTAAFADARMQATSDFERSVLADDMFTKAEYDEAVKRFIACLHDTGSNADMVAEADPLIPGAFNYRGEVNPNVPREVRQRILESCASGTIDIIEPLFIATIVNPANTDLNALTLNCLREHGQTVSKTDLPALREAASSATARVNPSRSSTTPDEVTVSCLANPAQTGASTAEDAIPASAPPPLHRSRRDAREDRLKPFTRVFTHKHPIRRNDPQLSGQSHDAVACWHDPPNARLRRTTMDAPSHYERTPL